MKLSVDSAMFSQTPQNFNLKPLLVFRQDKPPGDDLQRLFYFLYTLYVIFHKSHYRVCQVSYIERYVFYRRD